MELPMLVNAGQVFELGFHLLLTFFIASLAFPTRSRRKPPADISKSWPWRLATAGLSFGSLNLVMLDVAQMYGRRLPLVPWVMLLVGLVIATIMG
jgi:hypothetical protein